MNPTDVMLWILVGFFGLCFGTVLFLMVWFMVDVIRGKR